jgi:hypothetical protein
MRSLVAASGADDNRAAATVSSVGAPDFGPLTLLNVGSVIEIKAGVEE